MRAVPQWLVPAACLMHGLGMIGGVYFVFATKGWPLEVAPPSLGMVLKAVVAAIWVVSGVVFIAGAWGLFKDLSWWRTALWVGAPATLAGVALWVNGGLPFGVYVGAAFSGGILVALARGW